MAYRKEIHRNGEKRKYKGGILTYDKTCGWIYDHPKNKNNILVFAYQLDQVKAILEGKL